MPTEIVPGISNVATETNPEHTESIRPGRGFLWWARFVACLLLLLLFLSRAPLVMLPILTLLFVAVVGPKGSFRRLWLIVFWACVVGAVISFLLVVFNLPPYIPGNALDWLAAGLVMWLIPRLFGWPGDKGVHRISRAIAWFFGVFAGIGLQSFIGLKETESWLSSTPSSELGMWRGAVISGSTGGLLLVFIFYCGAAVIAYRFDWLRKRASQLLFRYLGQKIKEQQ